MAERLQSAGALALTEPEIATNPHYALSDIATPTLPGPGTPSRMYPGRDHADPQLPVLWKHYWATRDRAQRNSLVLAYEHLVSLVTNRLPSNVRAYWDTDDLRGFGCLGLVEAIDRFDEDSHIDRFPGYAMKRIRGAIFDELRRLDWLPRTVRRRVITYRATVDALSNELGRVPRTNEVLETMGIDQNSASDLMRDVQSSQLLHLQDGDGSRGGDDTPLVELIVSAHDDEPEIRLVASERLAELRKAVAALPERQRTVVTLRFFRQMTQEQIGGLLGVSNSRVCQIQAEAMDSLRKLLTDKAPKVAVARKVAARA